MKYQTKRFVMATHEAVYLPYLTLDGDTKKPTAAAVTKGYVDQKHKVTAYEIYFVNRVEPE